MTQSHSYSQHTYTLIHTHNHTQAHTRSRCDAHTHHTHTYTDTYRYNIYIVGINDLANAVVLDVANINFATLDNRYAGGRKEHGGRAVPVRKAPLAITGDRRHLPRARETPDAVVSCVCYEEVALAINRQPAWKTEPRRDARPVPKSHLVATTRAREQEEEARGRHGVNRRVGAQEHRPICKHTHMFRYTR